MFKRILSSFLFGLTALTLQACASEGFQSGEHYETLSNPVTTTDSGKIEVLELFWYGCPHCDSLDPSLEAWKKTLPDDVMFTRVPVVFGQSWEMHARIFWVAKNLGLLETMHQPLFNAIHREGMRLQRVEEVVAFFERFGADADTVRRELGGFATESALRLTDSRVRAYGIRGVPAMVVNGQYVTGVSQAGGEQQLFELLNHLIEKSRS